MRIFNSRGESKIRADATMMVVKKKAGSVQDKRKTRVFYNATTGAADIEARADH